jgi:hypothetical protein
LLRNLRPVFLSFLSNCRSCLQLTIRVLMLLDSHWTRLQDLTTFSTRSICCILHKTSSLPHNGSAL